MEWRRENLFHSFLGGKNMDVKNPIETIVKNYALNSDNDLWAYYVIPATYILKQNHGEQETYKRTMEQFINGLQRFGHFSLDLLLSDMKIDERFSKLAKDFDPDNKKLGSYYAESTVAMLEKELGVITEEKFLVGVKLNEARSTETFSKGILETKDRLIARMIAVFGYRYKFDDDLLKKYVYAEEQLFQKIGILKGRRAKETELKGFYHYNFVRGMKGVLRHLDSVQDQYSMTDSELDPTVQGGMIELTNMEGKSYMCSLPISNFDKNMRFNHCVELSQELPFPVEFHMKGKFEALRGLGSVKSKTERAQRNLTNTAKEMVENGDAEGNKGKFNRFVLKDLSNKVEEQKPIIKWLGMFTVYGSTPKECRRRVNSLIEIMNSAKVSVVRGTADQLLLFHKSLQAEPLRYEKNWIHYTTAEGISEMMYGVSNKLGDNVGWVIGRLTNLMNSRDMSVDQVARSSKKIVQFNPFLGNEEAQGKMENSPHIAITGSTGGGKSFLAKLIFMYFTMMIGKGLYIDPKSELRKWFGRVIDNPYYQKKYPLFVNHLKTFKFVTLDPDKKENWGVLDPICFLDGSNAKDTAESIFEQIYNFKDKDIVKTQVLQSIKRMIERRERGEKVGLMNVVDELKESNDQLVREAGALIFEMVDGSILRLAFSYGDTEGLNLNDKVTILEISGLSLPKETADPLNYSNVQKKSIALMLPLGKFCEYFGLRNYEEHTYEFFDEAWIFTKARGGSEIISSMKKVGRSQNNILALITQSIHDVNTEEESGNFGRIFAFDKLDERKDILESMGIEATEANLKWFEGMPSKHCLYKDLYQRKGKMVVHCPFEEMREAFKTVDETGSGNLEEMYA